MNLNDKIKQILIDKNLTSSLFADEVGIQRSSMSHILAGRNKPSLDIVQKIIKRFPDLGMDWIMEDSAIEAKPAERKVPAVEHIPEMRKSPDAYYEPPSRERNETNTGENTIAIPKSDEKIIERVMIFYSDGTFKAYRP